MGKSKQMKVFTLENGRRVVFNQDAFEYMVNQKAREIDRKNGKQRGGKAEIIRMIATKLRPYNPDSACHVIKNWYHGYNGPDVVEDIKLLAEILECGDEEALLKEIMEENQMNTAAEMINITLDQNKIIRAIKYMKEKEVAHELYSVFIDMIGSYMRADIDIWFEYAQDTPEWKEAIKRLPDRYPIEQAITKAAMYLSKDTIMKAGNLLEEMYGPNVFVWHETNRGESLDLFIEQRHELYNQYCEEKGIKKEPYQYIRDDDWNNFSIELNEDWLWKVDRVFEEYLPE